MAHDSEGYEPGDDLKFKVLKNFIIKRSKKHDFSDRLHAVWFVRSVPNFAGEERGAIQLAFPRLCITTPFANGRIFERGDEEVCSMKELGGK